MMNCFTPNDEISFSLLKSIPRKTFHWLNKLEQDLAQPGKFGSLSWNCSVDCGKLTFANDDARFSVSWSGNVDDITDVQSSDERVCNIANNLDWFTQMESLIYTQLEDFEKYLLEQRMSESE